MIVLSNIFNFKCVSQHQDVSQVQGFLYNVLYKLDLWFPCRIHEVVCGLPGTCRKGFLRFFFQM